MAEAAPAAPPGAKKRDYWWTVLATDPVAVPLVSLLARRRWLTPDQVTAFALVSGLAVGAAFATGTRAGLIAGGVLFYVAFLFDCVDGKLARALGVTSEKGEALDHLADGGRRASASLGLALWTWRSGDVPRDRVLWVVVYAVLAYYFIEISGAEKGESAGGVAGRLSGALAKRRLLPNPGMPDVQAVVFILGPITGLVVPALGVGIAMVTAAILLTVWRRLR
jgi:phosphatidylglycerophosphate synthase